MVQLNENEEDDVHLRQEYPSSPIMDVLEYMRYMRRIMREAGMKEWGEG